MVRPPFETFKLVWEDLDKFPSLEDIASHYSVHARTVYKWFKVFAKEGKNLKPRSKKKRSVLQSPLEQLESTKLKDTIKILEKRLDETQRLALSSDELKFLIHKTTKNFDTRPNWLTQSGQEELHGIPLLFISDIHYDEYVDSAQINFVNAYSRKIANERIKNTFISSIRILTQFVAKPKYHGAVIALGGDLLSGNIHEELAQTNEAPILSSILELTQLLIDGITSYADTFQRVFVPCVVGNHGRLHKKPRYKNRVFDNFEWLIYQTLARHFKEDDRVSFLIPDAPDAVFNIYDKTFLLTHGDQFRGGSGISGIMTPLHLGLHKKQKKQAAIHQSFDVMLLGHFHQYIHTNSMIVNGSIKGYDEFANLHNFPWEPAQQALWINHPQYGMVFRTPVLCDKQKRTKINNIVGVFK